MLSMTEVILIVIPDVSEVGIYPNHPLRIAFFTVPHMGFGVDGLRGNWGTLNYSTPHRMASSVKDGTQSPVNAPGWFLRYMSLTYVSDP
jgi:hypothetical protein